jgi:Phosphate-selective porin O and P
MEISRLSGRRCWILLGLLVQWGSIGARAVVSTPDADATSNAALLKKVEALESRVEKLQSQVNAYEDGAANNAASGDLNNRKALFGLGYRSNATMSIGSYGELKFGQQQNPADSGHTQTGFDAARIVLLPTYQITDNIIFNAEIEFEHGGSGFDNDDKLGGTAEIEQAYVDFKFNDNFNWRAPGVDVVPFGYTNLFHEPTQFYSVNRPELAQDLIPTTWFEGSTSFYGKIVDGLNYQFQFSSSLEDYGSNIRDALDSNAPPMGGYEAGISGTDGLAFSRSPVGDFHQLSNNIGGALRLSYEPPFAPGLAGSSSFYFTPNTTPRGAYGDNGQSLGHSSLTMADTELRYRIPKTGFEFRGEGVAVFIGSPGNLRANNDTDPTNNVGSMMWGLSLEAAYHFTVPLKNGWELVPFYRFTMENFQTGEYRGSDQNMPTGQGRKTFHTVGLAAFPTPQVVLKLDYQWALDDSSTGPQSNHLLGSVGYFF